MSAPRALASGFIGACVLTLLHEGARRVVPQAPRLDRLGRKALARGIEKAGGEPPSKPALHTLALVGDVLVNGLHYSLVGAGKRRHALLHGALLGLADGLGAVLLPPPLGLGRKSTARTPETAAMTVGLYLAGGLAAAAIFRALEPSDD